MLPKLNRLPHSRRIAGGSSFPSPFFLVKYTSNGLGYPRFGIIISKKVDKRATIRNRIRRLLHQFIQEHMHEFSVNKDYLFIIHQPFPELSEDIKNSLVSLIKQSSL
ncbi:MAG: ribonuclease P protein component [Patescibacteria group bacterium]